MTELAFSCVADLLEADTKNILIAYSGGLDSQVLLHLCAAQTALKPKLSAVHIHHGLQSAADVWAEHCRRQCEANGVNYIMLKVNATPQVGESPEAAARRARYAALQQLVQADDVLLVAQHREDQLETVLLQLFRGCGLAGLAAMPVSMAFGKGKLLRPLLHIAKQDIQRYAQRHALQWQEDPSNQSNDFDRNYLRNQIIPLLKQRWPALDKTVARTASHCGQAWQIQQEYLSECLSDLLDPQDQGFNLAKWQLMASPRQALALRNWLINIGLRPPSQAQLQVIITQLIPARDSAQPQLLIQGHTIRKYRQKLYCLPVQAQNLDVLEPITWPPQITQLAIANLGQVSCDLADMGIDRQIWQAGTVVISFRHGGEKLKLSGRVGHHRLKNLFQEAGVPPWQRDKYPLIYIDQRLAAVAGLWVAEWAWSVAPGKCYQLHWQPN